MAQNVLDCLVNDLVLKGFQVLLIGELDTCSQRSGGGPDEIHGKYLLCADGMRDDV